MHPTRDHILSTATTLVRTLGYAGFSYADISKEVGIRKASIHNHFPTKEDLVVALVDKYQETFEESLEKVLQAHTDAPSRLRGYAELYLAGLRDGESCLCGMLASDSSLVPERVRAGVARFFAHSIEWLERVITQAQGDGKVSASRDAGEEARMFHATILGAMFAARVRSNLAEFVRVSETALRAVLVPGR